MKKFLNKTPTSITTSKIIQTKKSKSTTKLKIQKQNNQLTTKPIISNQSNRILNYCSPNQKKNFYFLQKKQIKRH